VINSALTNIEVFILINKNLKKRRITMSKQKELEQLFLNGKITRREFIARLSAFGLMAAVSPALLATTANAAKPKKGGQLIMGLGGGSTTDSLDPGQIPDVMPHNINWSIRNNLVEIDADGNTVPELAMSWESSPDASIWYFKIRSGVEFHNGKTLDSQDVVDSINHHRGEDSKSAAKGIVDQIKDIKTDGKSTAVFYLQGGNADFPFLMSDYHLTIQPAGTEGAEFEKGIGTGAYTLVKHEPGVRALVKRNPNYWKEGRAHFDEVEIIAIVDVNSRTNALKTGQIHAMNRCETKTLHLLRKSPGVEVLQITGFKHFTFPMHMDIKPYDNNDVRMALKLACDREQMVDKILRGCGTVGNDHPIAPIMRFHASKLPQRKFDPDKAKYHIKKAGYQGHTFNLHTSNGAFDGAVDAAVIYKEGAAKAGINIEVVREPADGYWSNVWLKKPWCACYWSGRATEDWMFSTSYSGDSKWNDSHFHHKRFNELLLAARAELNEDKRREMYFECQQIVGDEGGVVVPMFADQLIAVTNKLGHPKKVAGNWEMDGSRMAERWWFA